MNEQTGNLPFAGSEARGHVKVHPHALKKIETVAYSEDKICLFRHFCLYLTADRVDIRCVPIPYYILIGYSMYFILYHYSMMFLP